VAHVHSHFSHNIRGPALIEFLDHVDIPRVYNGPFIMPIADKMKGTLETIALTVDMGTVVMGKIESGRVKKGQKLQIMPNKVKKASVN